jgi:hypothetical protein
LGRSISLFFVPAKQQHRRFVTDFTRTLGWSRYVPNTIPATCPNCQSATGTLVVSSRTVMTISCPKCHYMWAIDIAKLSPQLRQQLADALRDG